MRLEEEHRTARSFDRLVAAVAGNPRTHTLEHRLFNTISLLNGVSNLVGALFIVERRAYVFLLALTLTTGALFLVFYYLSRFRHLYRPLYWPFVLLIAVFLFANALRNAGSMGGAHYYFIPALIIAVMLSHRRRDTVMAVLLFIVATVALLLIEYRRPDWIIGYASANERLVDILASFLFVQVFTAVLVMILAGNLNQERRKVDHLLLHILPESIARELQQNERVQPLEYDCASVLFTDFVGFTRIAERLTPQELIEELDGCFRAFDQIVKRHGLEKIKTIGDAYMAAGGIPQANATHAVDCVLAALEIAQFMATMREEKMAAGQPYWQLRLGIHTGRLVAGVIGEEKFAYDVWGDTVNTASRLESSGVAGRINVSRATYEQVKDFFDCDYRGAVAAKNKGEIEMYFVNRIRPHLSRDGAGQTPNDAFLTLYKQIGPNQRLAAGASSIAE
jgi:adenylate cyclase